MSAQPPKRRKMSPLKATPVFNRNTEPASASRANYMSPTRASLSRFNPSLLPQPRSASSGPALHVQNVATPNAAVVAPQAMTPDQFLARGQEAFNYIMGNFNAQMQQTLAAISGNSPLIAAQNAFASPNVFTPTNNDMVVVPMGEETDEQMEAMRAAIRARKHQERAESKTTASALRLTPASARRTGSMLPQLMNQDEDDELSMEIARDEPIHSRAGSIRSSIGPSSDTRKLPRRESIPPVVDEEIEIDELSPDAPRPNPRTQRLASEDDGLPDTPEAIRRQLIAEDHPPRGILFSSPSKRRRATQTTPKKSRLEVIRRSPPVAPQKPPDGILEIIPEPVIDRIVATQPEPQQLAKQEEKARLEAKLRKLQEEVDHFERFAQAYTSQETDPPADIMSLIDLLTSCHSANKASRPEVALSSLLTSFLPFSIPVASPPTTSETSEQQERFLTHEPLKEKDPLPLNSLFTPLSIKSTANAPMTVAGTDRLSQKHSILLSSPASLLTCTLDTMISSEPVADAVPIIESLEIKDLSSWAKTETGTWLEKQCKAGDIAAVGYSLGRYWDISVKRAQCWIQCQKKFPHLSSSHGGEDQAEINDEEVSALDASEPKRTTKLSKRQLLPYLGQSSLVLQSEDAILRVSWKLQLDWTGEIESVVNAEATLPQSWYEADDDNSFRKIPATFDALMRKTGIIQAVGVVVELLFGSQG